jgi:DNA uptake protein ComE-like DNA-binding protein
MDSISKSWLYFLTGLLVFVVGGYFLKENRLILPKAFADERIYVQIKSGVAKPGIYEMSKGEKLKDLIQKAGGFKVDPLAQEIDMNSDLFDGQVIQLGDR